MTRHRSCQPAVNYVSALPKRLLDLSEEDGTNQVKVVLTDDSFFGTKYAALSYCWGNSSGYRLTSSTMTKLQAGIGIQEVPQTIQDAIYIARRLGLRWLWVDSLCIIQDSFVDWAREAESMVDVYQNCFLCIAAIGAASSNLGLFAERDPLLYQPCQMTTNLGDRTIFAYPSTSPRHDLRVDFDYSALHMRGWAVQERLLAPRTLSFGPRIFWECREHFCDETGMVGGLKKPGLKHDFSAMVLQNAGLLPPSEVSKQAIWTLWHEILEAYTRAKLTEKTDRLIALTGIIRAFERSTGWRNIDGLWGSFMPKDLAWCKNGHCHLDRALAGPSWSWIAVNGGVSAIGTAPVEDLARVEVLTDMRSGDGPNTRPHAMIRITCTPLKFTEVLPGASYGTLVDVHEDAAVQFSSDLAQSRSPEIYLPLVRLRRGHICGLALVSSVRWPGSYERVGFVKVFNLHGPPPLAQALLDPARRETITLV